MDVTRTAQRPGRRDPGDHGRTTFGAHLALGAGADRRRADRAYHVPARVAVVERADAVGRQLPVRAGRIGVLFGEPRAAAVATAASTALPALPALPQ
ncbi:hypothetical protein [Streptomyces sp. NPDC053427]|uniref:hypothetical protein n=1 Tax=Streptomyces sp. NPDC053427 TaxID=3365701 RepID=UPI0037D2301B